MRTEEGPMLLVRSGGTGWTAGELLSVKVTFG